MTSSPVNDAVHEAVATAIGAAHREDPAAPRTGGPAGNARLTAWTGLLLLAFFVVECVTLLSLHAMITVHILVGAFLVPLLLLKTATTGWRIARYYVGSDAYRRAGPPPLLLRILGPLVVLTGLAVLGTGLALIVVGGRPFTPIASVAGARVDALTLHQAAFAAWIVVTGLHVLGRTIPAVKLTAGAGRHRERVPGATGRGGLLLFTVALGIVVALLVLRAAGDWTG
jgi:hypothetical protein